MSKQPDAKLQDGATLGLPGRDFYRVTDSAVDMTRAGARPLRAVTVAALPQAITIDLHKTALIVIDMQNEFCSADGWLASMGADVGPARKPIGPIKALSAALRAAGVPIIWVNWGLRPDRANLSPGTLHTFNPTGCGAGLCDVIGSGVADGTPGHHRILQKESWGAAVVDELTPAPGDFLVDKQRISGFWDTPLDSILRNLAVRTVLFCGINADQCVYSTLIDANFHGYDAVLIEDGVATTSPDFCLQATLYNVRFAFGFTATSGDFLAALPSG
jgi:ureidoacrylate peracid hydrolase